MSRAAGSGQRAAALMERLLESVDQTTNAIALLDGPMNLNWVAKPRYQQHKRLQLAQAAQGDAQESPVVTRRVPAVPFRDVRRHRNRRSSKLRRQLVTLQCRQRRRQFIDCDGEIHRLLPSNQILEGANLRHGPHCSGNAIHKQACAFLLPAARCPMPEK